MACGRLRRSAVMAAAAAVLLAPAAHAGDATSDTAYAGTASFTEHSFPATATTPARQYWLYLPARLYPHAPLVVFLHGCNETAVQATQATHFDALADQDGFAVVYPQQTVSVDSSAPLADGNGIGCWNWFLPADQSRGVGEPGTIAGITRLVMAEERVDPRHVYVEGISAGADMAVILGAAYPDLYAGVGALAGCAYATCSDATGSLTHAAMGAHARVVPMFVENGSADTVNPLALSVALTESWLGADRMAGDGAVSRTPASTTSYDTGQTPQPGSGDACAHNDSLTCPGGVIGFQGSYPYTVSTFDDAAGRQILQLWVIHGMQHAHPDAPGDGPYTLLTALRSAAAKSRAATGPRSAKTLRISAIAAPWFSAIARSRGWSRLRRISVLQYGSSAIGLTASHPPQSKNSRSSYASSSKKPGRYAATRLCSTKSWLRATITSGSSCRCSHATTASRVPPLACHRRPGHRPCLPSTNLRAASLVTTIVSFTLVETIPTWTPPHQ